MRPALSLVEDSGAHVTSSLVQTREMSLKACITFIESDTATTYVGLGNRSIQTFSEKAAGITVDKVFPLAGLPLCGLSRDKGILIGADTGQVLGLTDQLVELSALNKGWIEQLAIAKNELHYAYSSGKQVYVMDNSNHLVFNNEHQQGTVMGLAFNQAGDRLATAHYSGVTVWDIASNEEIYQLNWPGAHLSLAWSPDDRFIMTTTQDKELHGWDLAAISEGKPKSIRMCGYPAKIRKLSWTADGKHLAAAGADSVTVWSFADGDPSGKPPYEFGYVFQGIVTQVAAHPKQAIVAAGYNNGAILIGKYQSGNAMIARAPCGHFITSLNWSADGNRLYAGTDSGQFIAINLLSEDF